MASLDIYILLHSSKKCKKILIYKALSIIFSFYFVFLFLYSKSTLRFFFLLTIDSDFFLRYHKRMKA